MGNTLQYKPLSRWICCNCTLKPLTKHCKESSHMSESCLLSLVWMMMMMMIMLVMRMIIMTLVFSPFCKLSAVLLRADSLNDFVALLEHRFYTRQKSNQNTMIRNSKIISTGYAILLKNWFCRDFHCFVPKSVLSRFRHLCLETNWTKDCVCGEKMTNIR